MTGFALKIRDPDEPAQQTWIVSDKTSTQLLNCFSGMQFAVTIRRGYHKLCTFNVLIIPTPFRAGQQPRGNSKFPLCNLPHKAWSSPEISHYINKFNLLSAFYTLLRQKLFCSLLLIRFTQSISFHCFHVGFGKKVETSFPWEKAGSSHISIGCKLATKFSQAACFWYRNQY